MFRIDVQGNENNIQIKTIQNKCTEDENNVQIKIILYTCVLIMNDLLRIYVWLIRS